MREIKFKAKLSHSKQWVIGNLVIAQNGQPYIIPSEVFEPDGHHLKIDSDEPYWVDKETISQFTGLNHIEVYYDDILELTYKGKSKMLQVSFSEEHQCLIFLYLDETKYNNRYTYEKYDRAWWNYNCKNGNIRRIGNIHDK